MTGLLLTLILDSSYKKYATTEVIGDIDKYQYNKNTKKDKEDQEEIATKHNNR